MLTFFRKIRKSLIDSSSARKYLLYAVGEIALVVIGILIALQINNWNEWRKDRIKESKSLQEIIETLELNVQILSNYIEVIEANKDEIQPVNIKKYSPDIEPGKILGHCHGNNQNE